VTEIGIIGASGYTGAELLRLCACATPTRGAFATGDTQAGTRVADLYPSLAAAYPDLVFAAWDPRCRRDVELVFLGSAPRGLPGHRARPGRPRRHVVDLAADFRLTTRPSTRSGTARPTPHPSCSTGSPTGCPSCSATRSRRARPSPCPGCYPTAAAWRSPRSCGRAGRADRHRRRRRQRRVGRRPAPEAHTTFCAVDEDFTAYGLLDHRHTPEIEQVLGASVLFTPHLAPMNRGILATCYARPTGEMTTDRRRSRCSIATLRGEPFVVVTEGRRPPRPPSGPTPPTSPPGRPPHRLARRDLRHRQPRQGRVGPGRAVRQPRPRPRRDHRLPLSPSTPDAQTRREPSPMSVTAPAGFVAAGHRLPGSSPTGARPLLVATADGRPVAAAAVFTQNKMTAAPVVTTARHLAPPAGRPRRWCSTAATPTRPPARGLDHAERMCAGGRRRARLRPRRGARLLTGLIGIPLPIDTIEAGIPALVAGPDSRRRRPPPPRPSSPPTRCASSRSRGATASSSAAWPRGPPCWRRTWPPCSPCSPPTPKPHPPSCTPLLAGACRLVQRPQRRRLHLHQRHRHPPGQRPGRPGRPRGARRRGGRGVRRPGPTDGRRRRGRHQGRPLTVTGAATDAEAAAGPARPPRASWSSARGTAGPLLGPHRQRARQRRDRLRPRPDLGQLRRPPGRRRGGGRRPRRRRPRRATWPAPPRDHRRPGARSGRATILTNDLTHAYVDENMGTS
jgi:N-acetyl-gamma-glutamyl-phosphate reductase